MVESHVKGSIVLVSSTVGLMGLVGYSQYSPMKFAIRGLAETLRSELLLYGINIHCYFPGTILSPGYELENKTKPQLTKELEGPPEEGLTPEQCAKGLLKGLARGDFFITTDFQSELFRAATATGGSIPSNNWLFDRIKASIALVSAYRHVNCKRELIDLYPLLDRPTNLAKVYSRSYHSGSCPPAFARGAQEAWRLATDSSMLGLVLTQLLTPPRRHCLPDHTAVFGTIIRLLRRPHHSLAIIWPHRRSLASNLLPLDQMGLAALPRRR